MGDDSVKIDLHEFYLSLDDGVLREAWDEAARRRDMDEADFWRRALNAWIQGKRKGLARAASATEDEEDAIILHGKDRDWTLREYIDAKCRWMEADERGDQEEARRILLEIPADPDFVMARKKLFGKEAVLEMGWDLTEANLKFGEGWLDK